MSDPYTFPLPEGVSTTELAATSHETTTSRDGAILYLCTQPSWNREFDIATAVICALCCLFGIVYTFFGYRFFKAIMFLTGFILGAMVVYLICMKYNELPLAANIAIALGVGILCGLITMLVQYVGLFLTGFDFGAFLSIGGLIVMEQFYHPQTKWIAICVLFGVGLIFAIAALKFQKGLTILGTSIFGAALIVASCDYFLELFIMVNYIWDRITTEPASPVCWYSWIVLGAWPFLLIVGTILQWKVTGKDFDHQGEQVQVIYKRKKGTANLHNIRTLDRRGSANSRYRHYYQVRRLNGDVISQSHIHSIHRSEPSPGRFHPLHSVTSGGSTNTNSTIMTQIPTA